jgi:hypothetical protein
MVSVCIRLTNTLLTFVDEPWMRYICNNRLTFLSHVYVTLVFQDVNDGLLYNSGLTNDVKAMTLGLISDRLDTNDVTIIGILHLLISEIGGLDEDVIELHQDGLVTCVRNQEDGLNPNIASFMTQ